MNMPVEGYLRRMDSREAADSGLLIWRKNFGFFIIFFAIPFWICAFVLRVFTGSQPPQDFLPNKTVYFSYLILWWLKPLFDRLILHVISIRFFESGANLRRLRRGLIKNLFRGLAGDLLWRRFSHLRSSMMPVRMLESVRASKGTAKSAKKKKLITERKKNLKKGGVNYCFFLTIWGIAAEAALLIGEILFFSFITLQFIPNILSENNIIINLEMIIFPAYCFNYMLVETIYVCMGFSLYINSRIEVEGWDLEIKFRSFAEKYGKKIITGALMFVLFLGCFFSPAEASADDWQPSAIGENAPIEELKNILDSPEFGGEEDTWGIRRKNRPEEDAQDSEPKITEASSLSKIIQLIFANILRIFLIVLITALVVILFIFARKMFYKKIPEEKKSLMTALHEIPHENPDELLQKSLELHKQGELRLAWGYCTAAVILSWQFYCGIIFPPNATESECVNMAGESKHDSDKVKNFGIIVKYWVNLAYAGKLPPPESFDEAVYFCRSLQSEAPLTEQEI